MKIKAQCPQNFGYCCSFKILKGTNKKCLLSYELFDQILCVHALANIGLSYESVDLLVCLSDFNFLSYSHKL